MYVYYFRTNNGSNKVLISKVIGKAEKITRNFKPFFAVNLDAKGAINKKRLAVPREEGVIFDRVFWLTDYDLDKANQIIDNYDKERFIKLRKQIETLRA